MRLFNFTFGIFLFLILSGLIFAADTRIVNQTSLACTEASDPSYYYINISDAVSASVDGNTIIVCDNGPTGYFDNVVVDKALNIYGNQPGVLVNASDSSLPVFNITADYVNISNFTVTGATGDYSYGFLMDGDSCNYTNLNSIGNFIGFATEFGSNNNLEFINVDNSTTEGIHLGSDATNNTISFTNINSTGAWYCGVYIASNNNNLTSVNLSNNWAGVCIHTSTGHDNRLTSITTDSCSIGVYLEADQWYGSSHDNTIVDSHLRTSDDSTDCALQIGWDSYSSDNNTITNSYLYSSAGNALCMWAGSNNIITNNTLYAGYSGCDYGSDCGAAFLAGGGTNTTFINNTIYADFWIYNYQSDIVMNDSSIGNNYNLHNGTPASFLCNITSSTDTWADGGSDWPLNSSLACLEVGYDSRWLGDYGEDWHPWVGITEQCVNLSDESTWGTAITEDGGFYKQLYVNEDVTLCTDTYSFMMLPALTVNANDIVIDCNGSTLSGDGITQGINNNGFTGVTVRNCTISSFSIGIYFHHGSNYSIFENNNLIYNMGYGILLESTVNNTLVDNNFTANYATGLYLLDSTGNNITNIYTCGYGVDVTDENYPNNTWSNSVYSISVPDADCGESDPDCTAYFGQVGTCLAPPSCVNLSDDSTYQGNVSGDMTNGFNVTGSITLCRGTYEFAPTENLTAINVTSDTITLDCNGSTIIGDNSTNNTGILSTKPNTTIKNCNLIDFTSGIALGYSNYGTIEGNNISSTNLQYDCAVFGDNFCVPSDIQLFDTNYTTIRANNLTGSTVGIFSLISSNNTISTTNFSEHEISILLLVSDQNNISEVNLNNLDMGGVGALALFGSVNNNIFNSTINSGNEIAVFLSVSSGNTFLNNTIQGDSWVYDDTGPNYFNDSTHGNKYYFSDGNGSWTEFPVYNEDGAGWADSGSYLPYGNSTIYPYWNGSSADYHPYTELSLPAPTQSPSSHSTPTASLSTTLSSDCNGTTITSTPGAKISVFDANTLRDIASGTTDADGVFKFDECALNAGGLLVRVHASKDNYISANDRYALADCSQCASLIMPECTSNEDCGANQICSDGTCQIIPCNCGQVQEHSCIDYACCSDNDCSSKQVCTDHSCVAKQTGQNVTNQTTNPVPSITKDSAQSAISDATSAISAASGKDTSTAQAKLNEANDAFANGDYELAQQLANEAKQLALDAMAWSAPLNQTTTVPSTVQKPSDWSWLAVIAVIVLVGGAAYYLLTKRKK